MNSVLLPTVSEELIAAWLDGNVTSEQDTYISQMCAVDPALQNIMDANDDVEATYEEMLENGFELPYELTTDFALPCIEDSVYTETIPYDSEEIESHDNDHSYEPYEEDTTDEIPMDEPMDYFDC